MSASELKSAPLMLSARLLEAALLAVQDAISDDPTRMALGRVCVTVGEKCITFTSTDGHRLHAVEIDKIEADTLPLGRWHAEPEEIRKAIALAKIAKGRKGAPDVDSALLVIPESAANFIFPEWSRVVPAKEEVNAGKAPSVNPLYLADACAAAAKLKAPMVRIQTGDDHAALLVTAAPAPDAWARTVRFTAVVMPMRT